MPRQPDPSRKPQLLGEIIEYLLDKPLASVSFRTIAQALGFSTYTLVYHFGTREQLVSEIVAAVLDAGIRDRRADARQSDTLQSYFAGFDASWDWTLKPHNRQLQRLEFEAALIEAVEPDRHTFSRSVFSTWVRIGQEALTKLGVEHDAAEVEVRLLVDTFYGIQYDFVLNGDRGCGDARVPRGDGRHREHIEALLPVAR